MDVFLYTLNMSPKLSINPGQVKRLLKTRRFSDEYGGLYHSPIIANKTE